MKFENKNRENRNNPGTDVTSAAARFGSSLIFKGDLSGDEDLVIEGQFEGKIDLENQNLVIEPGSKVKAEIRVKNITINGEVAGNVHASGKVFISQEGQMKGDINAPRVSIMDGAQFKGSVKMEKDVEKIIPQKKNLASLSPEDEKKEVTNR